MRKLSAISALHYVKLFVRSAVVLFVLLWYVLGRVRGVEEPLFFLSGLSWVHLVIFCVFAIEMLLRFFPSRFESRGCQKQFRRNMIPTVRVSEGRYRLGTWRSTLAVLLAWLGLNGAIAALYYTGVIDADILVLVALFYSVADMICILFFCPFQTWFMKNKCCGTCRIYNWDYAMMFTPLAFVPHLLARVLFAMGMLLLLFWEGAVLLHPERFAVETNAALRCENCPEKLCRHKSQLRSFLRRHADRFRMKENIALLGEVAKKLLGKDKKSDGKKED